MIPLRVAVMSEPGVRATNEDACGYWQREGPLCCALADGAGGHGGGDVAAQLAVGSVLDGFRAQPLPSPQRVRELIVRANDTVVAAQSRGGEVGDMRATLVVLALDPVSAHGAWGHVGDSRLYCFRQGFVVTQTKDHSLYQSMVDAGFAADDQRRGNPQRNVLTSSLGSVDDLVVDVISEPFVTAAGDAFLLCTDGLWDCVEEPAMEADLLNAQSPQDWLDRLRRRVIAADRDSQDNYSALAVWVGEMDFATRLIPPVSESPGS